MKNNLLAKLKMNPKPYLISLVLSVFGILALALSSHSALAACAAPATNYGSATETISVASGGGTYRVWSRIMIPSTTNSSYQLEIDGSTCFVVGGGSAIPTNTWTWVDYQSGSIGSKNNITFSATSSATTHTLKLIGNSAGVKVDKVLLLSDPSCMPTGTDGGACVISTPPPAPTVTLSASPTTVTQGQAVTLSSSASDNASSTICRVDFYDGSNIIGTANASPYSFVWNTNSTTTSGTHSITAKAIDALSLVGTSTPVNVTVNAAPPADTVAPTVNITAPTGTSPVQGTAVSLAATATDNTGGSGMKSVTFKIDNTTVGSPDTTSPYSITWNSTTVADGTTHTVTAVASDIAGNTSSSSVTITVSNAVPPPPSDAAPIVSLTSPTNGANVSSSAVALSATATDTDSTPVANVTFSVDGTTVGSPDTTSPYSITWNSTTVKNGSHTIMATATDTAGLHSASQFSVNVCNVDCQPPTTPASLTTAQSSPYNQVALSWTASTDNVGVAGYYIVRSITSTSATPTGSTTFKTTGTATTYNDTSVTANTNYSYYVYAYDAYGNVSANSNTITTTTLAQPDTQVPAWTTGAGLTATAVSTSQINLSWNVASDNVGVKSYQIFRNNSTSPIATITNTSYGDTGLTAGTTYSYIVKAVDAAGNLSLASNTANATTQTVVTTGNGNLVGHITESYPNTSTNPYSCSSHPTLSKVSATPTDATTLNCAKRIQWFLNLESNAGLTVDGWIGSNSDRAIRNYQCAFSLTIDGIVGPQTWGSLENRSSATSGPASGALVSYSANGTQHTVIANCQGNYTITGIPANPYNFTYSLPRYTSQTSSVTISGGQTATNNITLKHL